MQSINQILSSHFDDFGQKVVETYIRPLKIKDSVPKYRVSIPSAKWQVEDSEYSPEKANIRFFG